MAKKTKPKYINGWKCIFTDPPPEHGEVLLTNNPEARNAQGGMSHIWIGFPIKSGRTFVTFDACDQKIHGVVAWHPLPDVATK